nr:unnamed protein product [Callosobruchus chinensis]
MRPSLECCSHSWGAAAPTTLYVLDAVQRRAIRHISDPALTCHLQSLSHRRAVDDLSLFCPSKLTFMIPPLTIPARCNALQRSLSYFITYSFRGQSDKQTKKQTDRKTDSGIDWRVVDVIMSPKNLSSQNFRNSSIPITCCVGSGMCNFESPPGTKKTCRTTKLRHAKI